MHTHAHVHTTPCHASRSWCVLKCQARGGDEERCLLETAANQSRHWPQQQAQGLRDPLLGPQLTLWCLNYGEVVLGLGKVARASGGTRETIGCDCLSAIAPMDPVLCTYAPYIHTLNKSSIRNTCLKKMSLVMNIYRYVFLISLTYQYGTTTVAFIVYQVLLIQFIWRKCKECPGYA